MSEESFDGDSSEAEGSLIRHILFTLPTNNNGHFELKSVDITFGYKETIGELYKKAAESFHIDLSLILMPVTKDKKAYDYFFDG